MQAKEERAETRATYYLLNKERIRAQAVAWRKAHPEKAREQERKRPNQEKRRKAAIARAKKWQKEHPERVREIRQKHYHRHTERRRATARKWYRDHKEAQFVRMRAWRLKNVFGLTEEQYKAMGSACQICGLTEDVRRNKTYRLSIDHIKGTKSVRGLLCGRCNSAIGLFDHDEARLRKAIEYLERHRLKIAI